MTKGFDCFLFNNEVLLACRIQAQAEAGTLLSYIISLHFNAQCVATDDYDLTLAYRLAGGALTESGDSPYPFRSTRFRPKIDKDHILTPTLLRPRSRAGADDNETGLMTVVLRDDIGCERPADESEVTLSINYVRGSNFQTYIPDGDKGTGIFSPHEDYAASVKENPPQLGTEIVGMSDEGGLFKPNYAAQETAGDERLKVEAKLLETADEPEFVAIPDEREFEIAIPGLVRITHADTVAFADGGTCPQHGDGYPNWVRYDVLPRIRTAAEEYNMLTGRLVSVNDASLPLGGVIENPLVAGVELGRGYRCHVSHRQGTDVDINSTDRNIDFSPGESMWTYISYDGGQRRLVDILTNIMATHGMHRVHEDPIHYRLN